MSDISLRTPINFMFIILFCLTPGLFGCRNYPRIAVDHFLLEPVLVQTNTVSRPLIAQ